MKLTYLFWFILSISLVGCRQSGSEKVYEENKQQLSPDERFGELFVAVQMGKIFPDGKTFVDCIPKFPTDEIMARYEEARDDSGFDLAAFVKEHFDLPPQPASGYTSDTSQSAIEHINTLWPVLTRQPDADDAGSLIPLPHPYVVPGGRFREIYYWDSYFTMLGLQAAGREDMMKNMIDNFAWIIDTIGFIPNGNRSYFLTRSQPPFFSMMVGLLAQTSGDSMLAHYLPQLRKEYDFWMDGRQELSEANAAVKKVVRLADGNVLNRFWDRGTAPRPESYREDVETAKKSGRPPAEVYRHLRSAAESGWDFSSRWLADPQDLSTIHTTDIIPVDLNALLYNLERTLADAYRLAGDDNNSAEFSRLADLRKQTLLKYCWNPATGFFHDYDFIRGKPTEVISLAGAFPLLFDLVENSGQARQVAQVIEKQLLKDGGVVSTTLMTGQQWDAPNGWAPLQWITIAGLRRHGFNDMAGAIRRRWVDLNLRTYRNTGKMVEKYNVMDMGLESGGGEYPVQDGFGWTNGVLLRLLTEDQNLPK